MGRKCPQIHRYPRSVLGVSLCIAECAPAVQICGTGAPQYVAAAAHEEQAATAHEDQYRPETIEAACSSQAARPANLICWASVSNPTENHRREAEVSACAGMSATERHMSATHEGYAVTLPAEEQGSINAFRERANNLLHGQRPQRYNRATVIK